MTMHRTHAQWADMNPAAVIVGSETQQRNVMQMMKEDLITSGLAFEAIIEAAELGDTDACHELARQAMMADCDMPLAR